MQSKRIDGHYCVLTPELTGGIAIIQIFGDSAPSFIQKHIRFKNSTVQVKLSSGKLPKGRIYYGHIVTKTGDVLDEVLIRPGTFKERLSPPNTWFLYCHGGSAVLKSVKNELRLCKLRELCPNTYINLASKLDYLSKNQRIALEQLNSSETEVCSKLKLWLLNFDKPLPVELDAMHKLMQKPPKVLIFGPANTGKSTLFNRLIREDAAIVSPVPGTTRDKITRTASFNGIPVNLTDSAGFEQMHRSSITKQAYDSITKDLSTYDVIILVTDQAHTERTNMLVESINIRLRKRLLIAFNKVDKAKSQARQASSYPYPVAQISAKTGEGIDKLKQMTLDKLGITTSFINALYKFLNRS